MEKRTAKTAAHYMWCLDWLRGLVNNNPGSLRMQMVRGETVDFWFLPDQKQAAAVLAKHGGKPGVSSIHWIN